VEERNGNKSAAVKGLNSTFCFTRLFDEAAGWEEEGDEIGKRKKKSKRRERGRRKESNMFQKHFHSHSPPWEDSTDSGGEDSLCWRID